MKEADKAEFVRGIPYDEETVAQEYTKQAEGYEKRAAHLRSVLCLKGDGGSVMPGHDGLATTYTENPNFAERPF